MSYSNLPYNGGTPREIANVVNNIMNGKINSTGNVTLTNSSATTTLSDARIGENSVILFMPTTSDASTVTIHVTGRQKGQATLNHASATTPRSFGYIVFG